MPSFQMGYTNSIVSKVDTYLLQHLACKGAEILKTVKQLRSLDLWTHLPQFWLSRHSLNLFPHSASGWLHIAHCWVPRVVAQSSAAPHVLVAALALEQAPASPAGCVVPLPSPWRRRTAFSGRTTACCR